MRDDSIMKSVCSQNLSDEQLLIAFNVSVGSGNVTCAELLLSSERNRKILNTSKKYYYTGLVISPPVGKKQGYYNYPMNGRKILKLLINNGFDPYVEQPGLPNAVDMAYTYKDIEALMLLDVKDKYKEYRNSFILDVKSPFLGNWTNNKDGFQLVKISFGNEGKASVFISIGSMEHYWRMIDINKAEILTPIYQNSVKNDELTCIYNHIDDSVTFNLKRMGEEESIKLIREENSNKSSSHRINLNRWRTSKKFWGHP